MSGWASQAPVWHKSEQYGLRAHGEMERTLLAARAMAFLTSSGYSCWKAKAKSKAKRRRIETHKIVLFKSSSYRGLEKSYLDISDESIPRQITVSHPDGKDQASRMKPQWGNENNSEE
jgi:hypothetical protein